MMKSHPKWGLALGGGGARGIAHVGVLKILQRENLVPDVIAGSSIGALVGGAFACRPDADALEERLYEVLAPGANGNKSLKQMQLMGEHLRGELSCPISIKRPLIEK